MLHFEGWAIARVSLDNRDLEQTTVMKHPFLAVVFCPILISLGFVCMFYPRKFIDLNRRMRGNWIKPMPKLMGAEGEVWVTRLSGAAAILMALFIYAVLWTNR